MATDTPDIQAIDRRVINRVIQQQRAMLKEVAAKHASGPAIPLSDDPDAPVAEGRAPLRDRLLEYGAMRATPEELVGARLDEYNDRVKMPPGYVSKAFLLELVEHERAFQKARGNGRASDLSDA